MTITITGGAVFIGSDYVFHTLDSHLECLIICIDKLAYAGDLFTLASLLDPDTADYNVTKASGFRFCKADICDREGADEESSSEPENKGTLILDATCASQQISFPQDINLLNEARENLEQLIRVKVELRETIQNLAMLSLMNVDCCGGLKDTILE